MAAMMMPAMAELASSGKHGTCDWTFDSATGLLTISSSSDAPWNLQGTERQGELKIGNMLQSPFAAKDEIREVMIEESVFEIGTGAFMGCRNLKKITFPSTIGVIGFSSDSESEDILYQLPWFACTGLETLVFKTKYSPDLWNGLSERETMVERWGLEDPSKVNLQLYDESIKNFVESGWGVFHITSLPAVAEGKFGANDAFSWKVSGNGKLTVSGNGAMPDFETIDKQPWNSYISKITEIVVAEGITHVGSAAFAFCGEAESAYLPATLKSIGENAFNITPKLTEITCASISVPTLGKYALPTLNDGHRYIFVWSYMESSFEADSEWNKHTIVAFGAQQTEVFYTDVEVESLGENILYITWPEVAGAVEYVITLTSEDGTVEYEITFGKDGKVTSYVKKKAPSRLPQYTVEETIDGFGLTLNGLESGKKYNVTVVAKDETKAIATYKKTVSTVSNVTTGIDEIGQSRVGNAQKVLIDGKVLILRDGKAYNVLGAEMR